MNIVRTIAVALLALACVACEKPAGKPDAPKPRVEGDVVQFPPDSPQLASVSAEPAMLADPAPLRLNGRLVWDEEATVRVYSPFGGRVARILAQPGETVRAGQVLALLASPDFGQAQAELRRAETDVALARQNLSRIRELVDHGVLPRKDLAAAEADQARAEVESQRATARVRLYGGDAKSIDQTVALRSPISGTVVEKTINPGQEVRADQAAGSSAPLFVVTDPGRLWVLLDAHERDLAHIGAGRSVSIRAPAWPDEAFEGRIVQVADFVDPATRTVKVRGTVPNAKRRLKGEMFVAGEVATGTDPQVTLPARAIYAQADRNFVFVDAGGGKFVRTEVRTGGENHGRVVILGGVKEGARVVVEGTLLLQQMLQPRRVVH